MSPFPRASESAPGTLEAGREARLSRANPSGTFSATGPAMTAGAPCVPPYWLKGIRQYLNGDSAALHKAIRSLRRWRRRVYPEHKDTR
jgi:hypothetical protein